MFRCIGGRGGGGSSVLGPMYIAEIAPAKWRGRLVGFFQFNVVAGILVAYLSNFIIRSSHLGESNWRWMLGVAGVPALLFLFALFGIPESPRWLLGQGRREEAQRTLVAIDAPNAEREMRAISESLATHEGHPREPLFQRRYGRPIFLAVSIAMFNQLSGINAILYYLNDIFARAGFSQVSSDLQSVSIGLTNLVFTMLAMSIIDRVGRKTLLLIGSVGMAAALAGVAAIFLIGSHESMLVWCLVAFIAFFAFSQGAVIWVFISEVFTSARQRPEPGDLHALGVQCRHRVELSGDCGQVERRAIYLFCGDDGGSAVCGVDDVSGDERHNAGGHGTAADCALMQGCRRDGCARYYTLRSIGNFAVGKVLI